MAGISSGLQENRYWTEILKEDLGIVINLLPSSTDTLNAMFAAKSISADLVHLPDTNAVTNAIQVGLLVNLDDHQDKLPNVYANVPLSIQYVRDNVSNGTGRVYAVRNRVSTQPSASRFLDGPYLRWDFYKELGYPELTNLEDYLPLMRKMLDNHPTNDNGQRMYGFALFSDWDDTMMQNAQWIGQSKEGKMSLGYLEVDLWNNSIISVFDDTSSYKKALKFLYDANQMGLVDPNSPSMGFTQQTELSTAGRILFWPGYIANTGRLSNEEEAAGKGYRAIPFKNERLITGAPSYVGEDNAMAISKDTKHLDKALAYLDYLYSYDGVWNLVNGRRGVKWDLNANGVPYLTTLGWDIQYNNKEFPNGGPNGEGGYYVNFTGLSSVLT
jgi:putative aldouronate transport system substrate-binding protein